MERGRGSWWPRSRLRFEGLGRYLSAAGAAITVAITLTVALSTGVAPNDLKLALDFCIGLLGVAIVLQLEALVRVSERARKREQYANLLDYIEEYPVLLPILTKLSEATVTTMSQTKVPEFKDNARRLLNATQLSMRELAEGRWLSPPGDNSLMFAHYETVKGSVLAVTDDSDTDWWGSATGKRYLELNKAAAGREVSVQRVFLLSCPPTPETLKAMDDNVSHDVKVLIARADQVDPELRINITMFDDKLVHEDIVNRDGLTVSYMYTENEIDLNRCASLFSRLCSRANPYSGPASANALFAT
jgi:hypothetical protein